MSVVDWIRRLWSKDATHFVFAPVPAANVFPPVQPTDIKAEEHYFRVWLSEMFLEDDRRLFREFVPVVHSSVRLTYGGATKELPYVAGPHNLNLGSTLGKGVQIDHALTNLLPFRGGNVDLTTALVAYKQKDYFQGLVGVLHDVSGLLNAGQLSASLKVVEGAIDGVQALLGAGEKDVHLLFYRGFGGTSPDGGVPLRSGYTAVIRANADRFDTTQLYVKDSRLHRGRSADSATPLDGYDYMLLRLEAATERDDFQSFELFAKFLADAIREGARERAKGDAMIATANVIVWDSTDLTISDRYRVAKALRNEYERALGGAVARAASAAESGAVPADPMNALLRGIHGLDRKEKATALKGLLARPTPTLDDFVSAVGVPSGQRSSGTRKRQTT